MPKPYLERHDGDLISASDWNEIQVRTREDIAAVDAKFTGIDPTSDVTVRNLTVTGAARLGLAGGRVLTAYMNSGLKGDESTSFNSNHEEAVNQARGLYPFSTVRGYFRGGCWINQANNIQIPQTWAALASHSPQRWGLIPSPQMEVTLSTRSALVLYATGVYKGNQSSGHENWTQFVLSQSGMYAPVRVNPNNAFHTYLDNSGQWRRQRFSPPCEPNADTWPTWLKAFDDMAAGWSDGYQFCGWPVCGFRVSGSSYDDVSSIPWSIEEWCELPTGKYTVQIGFTTSYYRGALWLTDVILRALVIPLGDAP